MAASQRSWGPGYVRHSSRASRATCLRTGKRRFRDHEEAVRGLHSTVAARVRGDERRRECRVYECSACHGWHLTSQPVYRAAVEFEEVAA